MSPFSFEVYPKINVFLKILGLHGGYHTLISRLVLVKNTFKDFISIKTGSAFALKGDFGCALQENTIYKMLQALKQHLQAKQAPSSLLKLLDTLHIEVEKHIPTQAGLGGGSANAGMLLAQLNQNLNLDLSLPECYAIGAQVGSDVNFFISGFSSAHVYGRGEWVSPFKESTLEWEILTPPMSCQTARVYALFEKTSPFKDMALPSDQLLKKYDRSALNDLLTPALKAYPKLAQFEKQLPPHWFFSGSGGGFFALKGGA